MNYVKVMYSIRSYLKINGILVICIVYLTTICLKVYSVARFFTLIVFVDGYLVNMLSFF